MECFIRRVPLFFVLFLFSFDAFSLTNALMRYFVTNDLRNGMSYVRCDHITSTKVDHSHLDATRYKLEWKHSHCRAHKRTLISQQSSWGQHGARPGPVGPRWAPWTLLSGKPSATYSRQLVPQLNPADVGLVHKWDSKLVIILPLDALALDGCYTITMDRAENNVKYISVQVFTGYGWLCLFGFFFVFFFCGDIILANDNTNVTLVVVLKFVSSKMAVDIS